MNKKRATKLKAEVAMMVGMANVPEGAHREHTHAMTEAAVFYGYYRGLGFTEGQAAIKAKRAIEGK